MSRLLDFILDHEDAFKSNGRLASLYSDFNHQASTNPDGYAANITAWRKALVHAARAGVLPTPSSSSSGANDLLTLHVGEDLARELQTKQLGRPLCLGAVVKEMVKSRELIDKKDFLSRKDSIYKNGWGLTVPSLGQVLGWGLRQLGVTGDSSGDQLARGSFVVLENVEAVANAILTSVSSGNRSGVDLIYSREAFTEEFGNILSATHPLTPADLTILLTYLSRDKSALSYTSSTIKFKSPAASAGVPEPITENDITISKLQNLIASHEHQISILTARISELDGKARAAVAAKATASARSALRSKKLAEATLDRRTSTLTQLEEVYSKIEAAASNVEVVKVMEASAVALRSLNKQVGGVEGVEGIVDALREEMDKVDEVSGVVNEVGRDGVVVDEQDVEEEFEALENAERERKEAKEKEEREAREREEADATRRRLEELEKFKNEKEKENIKVGDQEARRDGELPEEKKQERSTSEPELENSIRELKRMSLEEDRTTEPMIES